MFATADLLARFGTRRAGSMYSDALLDELRRVERDVIAGEFAEQEALLVALKGKNEDTAEQAPSWY